MAHVRLVAEAPDDFEPGDCARCPFHYEEDLFDADDGHDVMTRCVMGAGYEECPAEVMEEGATENG